jgi:ribosomal protein S18 acetylase RimI-like enzyme
MDVSFGIEFEFDVIKSDGSKITREFPRGRIPIDTWDYQEDRTCAVELRSPIFTSIDQALEEISNQFNYWCYELEGYAPYPYNSNGRSLGGHIHIGLRNRSLDYDESNVLGYTIANVYPFLVAIQAQPIPSVRGLRSTWLRPLWDVGYEIVDYDHYAEINYSHHGTLELRLFDANIPQTSLTNAYILTEISKTVLENLDNGKDIDESRYRRDRNLALRYGLRALDLAYYLNYIKDICGDLEIPSYPFLKEILYLTCKYRLNVWNILRLTNVNEYYYFKKMFTNPSGYLENIVGLMNVRNDSRLYSIISDTIQNSGSVSTISDLIRLAEATVPTVSRIDEIPLHSRNLPSRTYVRECIQVGTYRIRRITDVPGYTSYDVAERISYLLRHHGDGYTNILEPDQIIDDPRRFYVLTVYDNSSNRYAIVGCIAIRMSSGEISSLVVDRRYRRLGIANVLLRHVLSISERPIWGYVRKENQGMINLLRSLGFQFEDGNDRSLRFYLPQNRRDQ